MGFLKRVGKHISRAQKIKDQPEVEEKEKPVVVEKREIAPQPMEIKEELGIPLSTLKDRPHKTETIKAPISELQQVNEKFPLVTINYKGAETIMVWANIIWDPSISSLRYILQEPLLSKKEEAILFEVKELLQDKLDIDFSRIRTEKAFNFLIQKFYTIIDELGYKLTEEQKVRMQYYIYRDFMGLGKIEALMHDENIEDISCDGIDIPIFIYHRNPKYNQMRTNITFKSKEEVDSFVLRLAQKSGKMLTIAEPLLDASLPDGSRIQATIGTDIAKRGSNFTIRKFTSKPMTPVQLMNYGTCSAELFAYLWIAIENRLSVLIGGSTATGKTTFLNALSLFIKPELKIITIEDTPELRLPHPNWISEVSRSGYGAMKYGEVSMFSLLKTALRQRPDFVIVGEVRGEEAYVMFQGMATGHAGMGTLHADNLPSVIDRLTTKPIDLPRAMLDTLDMIVFIITTRKENAYVRRVSEVIEIVGYDYKTRDLKTNVSFKWNPDKDEFEMLRSVLLEKIKTKMAYSIDRLIQDIENRTKLLKWLQAKNILDYREVAKYISLYYANPEETMELVT